MTEKTVIYSARVPKEVTEVLGDIEKRKVLEGVARLISEGYVSIKDGEIAANSVDTFPASVDTNISESVNTEDYCKGCEYMENALDMSKFNEVCEFKGLDRQKALDKCVQMLWR